MQSGVSLPDKGSKAPHIIFEEKTVQQGCLAARTLHPNEPTEFRGTHNPSSILGTSPAPHHVHLS